MMGGDQFPSLTALLHEFQPPAGPKRMRWHTAAEVLFLVGFFAVVIFLGGGE